MQGFPPCINYLGALECTCGRKEYTGATPKAELPYCTMEATPKAPHLLFGDPHSMAEFIPAALTVQAALNYTWRGKPAVSTLYFHLVEGTEVSQAEMQGLATNLNNWWIAELKANQSSEIRLDSIKIVDLTEQFAGMYLLATPLAGTGSLVQESVSNALALHLTFNTAFRGRPWQGGNFVPGLSSLQLVDDVWNTAYANGVAQDYNQLLTFAGTFGWQWVHLSRYENGQPRLTGQWTPVTSADIKDYGVAVQRGRRK